MGSQPLGGFSRLRASGAADTLVVGEGNTLNGRFALHGLDVEPLVARVVDGTLRKRNIVLDAHRREDLIAFCISELWVASRKFDAGRYREFRQFADPVVRRRVVDWLRSDRGRSRWAFGADAQHIRAEFRESGGVYERERPTVLSLDGPVGDDGGTLGDALPDLAGDRSPGGAPSLDRLLDERDRFRAQDQATIRSLVA